MDKTFLLGLLVALIIGFVLFRGVSVSTPSVDIPSATITQPAIQTDVNSPYDNSGY